MALPNGHVAVDMTPRKERLQSLFKGHDGALDIEPGNWTLPVPFKKYAKDISEFEVNIF